MAAPPSYLDDPASGETALTIPTFYLYGEPHRRVDEGFVHVEAIDDRSRPSEWTIQPHAHADLAHVFLIASGGGGMQADDRILRFAAPCLLLMPSTIVHGFDWDRETRGWVVTLSARWLRTLAAIDRDLAGLFDLADSVSLPQPEADRIEMRVTALMQELAWSVVGHRAAVQAALLSILVTALRLRTHRDVRDEAGQGRHRAIVARYRARVEARFRLREPIGRHAAALGVSETALRAACARVALCSPAAILDERALLEARRSLRYSTLSVAEIGYSLGFADPAYFSRFFTKHAGLSPRRYRGAAPEPRRDDTVRTSGAGLGAGEIDAGSRPRRGAGAMLGQLERLAELQRKDVVPVFVRDDDPARQA